MPIPHIPAEHYPAKMLEVDRRILEADKKIGGSVKWSDLGAEWKADIEVECESIADTNLGLKILLRKKNNQYRMIFVKNGGTNIMRYESNNSCSHTNKIYNNEHFAGVKHKHILTKEGELHPGIPSENFAYNPVEMSGDIQDVSSDFAAFLSECGITPIDFDLNLPSRSDINHNFYP